MVNFATTSTAGNVSNSARDQFNSNTNLTQNFTIIISPGSGPTAVQAFIDHILNLGGALQTYPQSQNDLSKPATSPATSSTPGSHSGKAASYLIDQILAMLQGAAPSTVAQNLHVLRKTIYLATLAIQAYEFTPLGRNLAQCINPEVVECIVLLRAVLDRMHACRAGLTMTRIRCLWRQVWQRGSEDEGLTALMTKLADIQRALGEALMALNSIAWSEIGDGLRAGRVSLREFHNALRQGPQSLRHIPTANVLVVDHLGRHIPIPTVFCSSWQDFDFVINGYCRDRVGSRFIERGDYQMVLSEDGTTIETSVFATTVEPGMVLEMSIVVSLADEIPKQCPKCQCTDPGIADGAWIEWKFSSAAPVRTTHIPKDVDPVPQGEMHDPDFEEIASPILSTGNSTNQSDDRDQDDTRLFRRVHLILPAQRSQELPTTSRYQETDFAFNLPPLPASAPPIQARASSEIDSFESLPGSAVEKRPRRRYDEIERFYQCLWLDCNKAYGTLNHLNAHITMQKHGPKHSRAEFKEARKQWRKAKKEEEANHAHSAHMYYSSRSSDMIDSDLHMYHLRHSSSHRLPDLHARHATLDDIFDRMDEVDGISGH